MAVEPFSDGEGNGSTELGSPPSTVGDGRRKPLRAFLAALNLEQHTDAFYQVRG